MHYKAKKDVIKTKKDKAKVLSLEEERELITKAKKEPAAFGLLYDHYYPQIFNYVYRRIVDFELANDITSEVFLKAYTNFWKFRWQKISIKAWFYRIATNEINMYFRKKDYRPSSLDALRAATDFEAADTQHFLDEKLAAEQKLQEHRDFLHIQAVLKLLPVKYQEVIALRYFEQKSIKEICEILNKKEGTVKSLISRGIDKIRNLL